MFKLMLNLHKYNNYAFFCPVSRLHLTVSSPVGFANEVTPAILKGVKANTILDVDGVIDIESGTVVEGTPEQPKSADKSSDNGDSKETDTNKSEDHNKGKEDEKVEALADETKVPEQKEDEAKTPESTETETTPIDEVEVPKEEKAAKRGRKSNKDAATEAE